MADRVPARWVGPALALLSLTLLAGGAELVLRWREARRVERILARDPTRELCTEPDPELLYRYASGRCGFNSRGYRDGEHALAKPPGVFRFAVIGDSVAAGDGVELDERFDRVLERRLAQSGVRAEAINLARTGYSTSQELIVLEKEAFAYHPDLVVWSYVLNDPADPIYHNANGRLGRFYSRPRSYAWHELARLLFKARERFAARACPDDFHLLLHCAYADRVSASLARIGALSASRHTPVLFVIHPVFQREPARTDSELAALHAELASEARAAGLAVVDLREAYAREAPGELQQEKGWFDPWHPNARGHAVAAKAIAAELDGRRDSPALRQ
jgi:lysophospholipase L1-like esterase